MSIKKWQHFTVLNIYLRAIQFITASLDLWKFKQKCFFLNICTLNAFIKLNIEIRKIIIIITDIIRHLKCNN